MKKFALLFSVIALTLVSCDNKSFNIEGTFTGNESNGKKVYLYQFDADSLQTKGPQLLDSALVTDGKFQIKNSVKDAPVLGVITLGRMEELKQTETEGPTMAPLILEPGTIKLSLDKSFVTLEGTENNVSFNKIHDITNNLIKAYDEAEKITAIDEASLSDADRVLVEKVMNLQKDLQKENFEFIKNNIANSAGKAMLVNNIRALSKDQVTELISITDTAYISKVPMLKQVKETLALLAAKEANIVGHPLKDSEVNDIAGKKVSLASYAGNGKVVLIDFWASWCGPCIQEIPKLKKVYEDYKGKGFDIVGVSVDEDKAAWETAIKTHSLPWTQLHDVTQAAANSYEISTIPFTLLVDKDGKVVAMNVRSEELPSKLDALLK